MNNITAQNYQITKQKRNAKNKHNSFVVWFTGLSGSGKSTIANTLEQVLFQKGCNTYVLDGDNIRSGLSADLGFSENDRNENIRRVVEVAKVMMDAGVIVITSFISPFETDRELAKKSIGNTNFIEVFVNCPLEICEQRDVKGLYSKARCGKIKNFTGIDSPFETPKKPDITVDTSTESIEECVMEILRVIETKIKN